MYVLAKVRRAALYKLYIYYGFGTIHCKVFSTSSHIENIQQIWYLCCEKNETASYICAFTMGQVPPGTSVRLALSVCFPQQRKQMLFFYMRNKIYIKRCNT